MTVTNSIFLWLYKPIIYGPTHKVVAWVKTNYFFDVVLNCNVYFFSFCSKTKKHKQKSKYCWTWFLLNTRARFHGLSCDCAAPGAGEGTSSGGDPTHPPRKKRARVDPTVESVSWQMNSGVKWDRSGRFNPRIPLVAMTVGWLRVGPAPPATCHCCSSSGLDQENELLHSCIIRE